MNGLPLSGHQNFSTLANNANQIAAARQAQLRQQNSNIPPGTMAQLQYQPQIPPGMHSQQLHQMQQIINSSNRPRMLEYDYLNIR